MIGYISLIIMGIGLSYRCYLDYEEAKPELIEPDYSRKPKRTLVRAYYRA